VRSERSSAGDPARTLELLWRATAGTGATGGTGATRRAGEGGAPRGPRQGLTVDRVVSAAVEVADAEGVRAVTMRRVARVLGVAPMSLYTYVPGKAELLDLMLDTVYGEMPRPDLSGRPWQDRVRIVAQENLDLYQRHPWVAAVSTARPPLGPGLMAKYEHELGAFAGLGLDDVEMDSALTYLLSFVQAAARSAADADAAVRESAMSDEQWWSVNGPLLARVFDEARYPTAARVGAAAGAAYQGAYSSSHAYTFGLERVLDGLGVLIDARG
jgi:AcrR family transcriptional regulator